MVRWLIPARAGKTGRRASWSRCSGAHPRACGENLRAGPRRVGRGGSSPRVRGKLPVLRLQFPGAGLIPARAGKTPWSNPARRCGGAHPRACGENVEAVRAYYNPGGSSPRVRGKPAVGGRPDGGPRLIPARAGKTPPGPSRGHSPTAHPRACGENINPHFSLESQRGSSPRVRGKRGPLANARCSRRLIPARAGKTSGGGPRPRRPCGSSPRVRGKRQSSPPHSYAAGLIPARAGKTVPILMVAGRARAHPRACGENWTHALRLINQTGSSPRVRGKPLPGSRLCGRAGLIPARAGKTSSSERPAARPRAHPRACGENPCPAWRRRTRSGSSPRVRGKRERCQAALASFGLIPARAGKTSA